MLTYNESLADKACNLECVQNLGPVHEFVGPVKIVLMDMPKDIYSRKACVSSFIGLVHMLIGITTMIVLLYTLGFKTPLMMNLHIVFCTVGYQFFIPSAILMMNSLHGPSAPLTLSDRKFQHLFLQVFGVACAATGSVLVMVFCEGSFDSKLTVHCIIGLVTGGLSAVTALIGPGAYFSRDTSSFGKFGKRTHAFLGMPAFFTSSLCFVIGIYTSKTFKAWAVFLPDLVYLLIGFCVFYTLVILSTPFMKFCGKTP